MLITHLKWWKGRQYLSHWSPCFGFFVCFGYSERTRWMLGKLGAQNKAVCENEGKQCVLSDHWKSIKMLFKNKWMTQKVQKDWLKYKF